MRLFEFTVNIDIKKLKNIEDILKMTDDDNMISFVEKTIEKSVSTEAVMDRQQRIAAIIKSLEESDDASIIDYIEGTLKQTELGNRVEKLWEKRGFNSGRMSKYKENFKSLIIQSQSSLRSKIELLYICTSNKTSIPKSAFEQSFKSDLSNIIPSKFLNNATFNIIKDKIFFADSFRGKGIGPGEFAFSLLGKNGNIVDHNGDIVVDGWGIEIKDGGGGSIKTGSPNSFRESDKLRSWIGQQLNVVLDRENKLKWDSTNEFTKKFNLLDQNKKQKIISAYINKLYPNLSNDAKKYLITGLIDDAGKPEVRQHFGRALLSEYKNQDQWNSILFIKKNGTLANVVDPNDAQNFLDFGLAGINRDGDTQALPDGYINGKIK